MYFSTNFTPRLNDNLLTCLNIPRKNSPLCNVTRITNKTKPPYIPIYKPVNILIKHTLSQACQQIGWTWYESPLFHVDPQRRKVFSSKFNTIYMQITNKRHITCRLCQRTLPFMQLVMLLLVVWRVINIIFLHVKKQCMSF